MDDPGSAGRGRLRGIGLVVAGIGAAVLVVLSLVVIVLTAPQKPRVPPVGGPAPALPAASGTGSPAALTASPVSASPSRSPARSPSPSPSRRPTPTPKPWSVQQVSYEAESPASILRFHAQVAPMDGASGGAGVYALGAPNGGVLRFTGVAVAADARYTLTVYFQNPDSGERTGQITVNRDAPVTVRYPSTGGCCVRSTSTSVTLSAGADNIVEFGNPASRAADIDRIVISG